MNSQLQDLAADLAAARSLAEEGRRGPLSDGATYVVFGVAVAACLAFNWAVLTRTLTLDYWWIPVAWFGGMTTASLLSRSLRRRAAARASAVSFSNVVSAAVWRAAGAYFGVYATALFLAMAFAPSPLFTALGGARISAAFSIFLPATFGVYAIAIAASAAAADSKMLRRFGWLSMLFMAATAALIGRSEQLLVGALGSLLVLAAPGALLLRRAARDA